MNLVTANDPILTSTYEVKINLIDEWNDQLNKKMLAMGYKSKSGGYTSIEYHKAMKRLISFRPRKAYYSKEFTCPDVCKEALSIIVSDIKAGKNLVPYMSKDIQYPKINDRLLNDWNIHHFHLNTEYEKDSIFIKRSDWLLLAFVNEDAMYCINVYPHKKPNLWSHIKMIEIIHNNWPELIERYQLAEVTGSTEKLDDQMYSTLRKANVSTFVELGENKVFGLMGGGYASDGSSIEAVRASNYWHNYLRRVEIYIRNEFQSLKKQMLSFDSQSMAKKIDVMLLALTEDELILLEKQRNVMIKIDNQSGNMKMFTIESIVDLFVHDYRMRRFGGCNTTVF